MNQYIISYIGGDQPSTPEQGKAHFAQYQEWLAALGDAVIKPMVPYKDIHSISSDGVVNKGSSVMMTGHTIVQFKSIEQAIDCAQSCPFLDINGSLEIAEMISL